MARGYAPAHVNVLVVFNPKSGRGRAGALVGALVDAIGAAGHEVRGFDLLGTDERPDPSGEDVVVVVGGDGTVHRLLPSIAGTGAALYHVPTGTENLFARQFGMRGEASCVVGALNAGRRERMDLGEANGRLFAIMCSAGPDASVVRRMTERRRGAIRHSSYVIPIMREVVRPSLERLTIRVDGAGVVEGRRGMVVIGNAPVYALGLDPVFMADPADGLLDVVFLEGATRAGLAGHALAAARGRLGGRSGVVVGRGAEIVVEAAGEVAYQLDGESGGVVTGAGACRVVVRPGALWVLRPA